QQARGPHARRLPRSRQLRRFGRAGLFAVVRIAWRKLRRPHTGGEVSGSAAAEPSLDKVSERRQLPLLWGVFFENRLRHLQDLQALPDYFRKVKDPHVTLAYAGSLASSRASLLDGAVVTGVAETALAKRHGISVEAFRRHSEDCQLWSGREVEVSISQLVQGTDGLVSAVTLPE
ncbi:unnamed protein product, partial [Polarella glacialis]